MVPDRMRQLLCSTYWDPNAVRDDLRSCVMNHPGDTAGVLIVDETGSLKKGARSAGFARHPAGTAGWIEMSSPGFWGRLSVLRVSARPP